MIFICWNIMVVVIVNVGFMDFCLLIVDWVVIVVFSSVFIVTTFANSSIFQVVIFIYFYVKSITNSIHSMNRTIHFKQNKWSERNRTEQLNGTEQLNWIEQMNRTTEQNNWPEQLITSYNRTKQLNRTVNN